MNSDIYLPAELEDVLSELKIKGRTITNVESPSRVDDSFKKERLRSGEYELCENYAEVDGAVYLTLDDGRKIGITFSALSCVGVYVGSDTHAEEYVDYEEGEITITDIFKNIIGKKIKDFRVHGTSDIMEANRNFDYVDKNFDKNQKTFIAQLDIIFETNDYIYFDCVYDFTAFHYRIVQ